MASLQLIATSLPPVTEQPLEIWRVDRPLHRLLWLCSDTQDLREGCIAMAAAGDVRPQGRLLPSHPRHQEPRVDGQAIEFASSTAGASAAGQARRVTVWIMSWGAVAPVSRLAYQPEEKRAAVSARVIDPLRSTGGSRSTVTH